MRLSVESIQTGDVEVYGSSPFVKVTASTSDAVLTYHVASADAPRVGDTVLITIIKEQK